MKNLPFNFLLLSIWGVLMLLLGVTWQDDLPTGIMTISLGLILICTITANLVRYRPLVWRLLQSLQRVYPAETSAKAKALRIWMVGAILGLSVVGNGLEAQNLVIDVAVSNTTPGPSDVFTYRIRYRCASITDHCYNAHITYTLPSALEVVSLPGIGGNVASATATGNAVDIHLVSPTSAGAPAGTLAAGSSGILETRVRFKCGVNGVNGYPTAGSTINFVAGPTFSVTGGSVTANTSNTAITVPTANACAPTPPPNPPATNIGKSYGTSSLDGNLNPGDGNYYIITIPATTSTGYYVEDDLPEGISIDDQTGFANANIDIEIYAAGNWYSLSSFNGNWFAGKSVGNQMTADGGVPIPGVYFSYYDNQYFTAYASGVDKIRYKIIAPITSQIQSFLDFRVDDDASPGKRENCLTTNHPDWTTVCSHSFYVMDKPLATLFTRGGTQTYWDLGNTNLGAVLCNDCNDLYAFSGNPNLYKDPLDLVAPLVPSIQDLEGGMVVETLLPEGFNFITDPLKPNFWFVVPFQFGTIGNATGLDPDCLTPTFTQIPNHTGTRTLLRWEFPACSGDLTVVIYYSARYALQTPIPNTICVGGSLSRADGGQLAYRGNSYFAGQCLDKITVGEACLTKPTSGGDMNSIKWVQGALDAQQSRYPLSGNTNLAGDGIYEVYVSSADWQNVKQLDIVDILPFIGDQDLLSTNARGSAWSAELAGPITIERYKIGTGLVDASADLTYGVQYTTSTNPCYLDAALPTGQVVADVNLANAGKTGGCTDFSGATPAAGARGFLFRWLNSTDPLIFGEYLKVTVPIRQLAGEPDNLSGGISWNSVAFTATESDDDQFLSSEPLKVGLKMIDPSQTATIGDYVWLDDNANGRQDVGETPLAGVVVSLYDASGQPVTQTVIVGGTPTNIPVTAITDQNGYYCFQGLTPNTNYAVRLESPGNFNTGGILAPYTLTTANAAGVSDAQDSDATLGTLAGSPSTPRPQILAPTFGAGTQTKTYDFGFICLGTVSGYVWMDSDNSGDQDAGEMGLSGISVTLYDASTNIVVGSTVMSSSTGTFTLGNVPAGTYYLSFTGFPAGKIPTFKDLTGNDGDDSDVLSNGRTDVFTLNSCGYLEFDLGLRNQPVDPASICGTAWDDLTKDGTFATDEPGIANVTVQLLDANGIVINTTTTDASGNYCFTNLDPNVGYRVAFVPPSGTVITMFSVAGPDQDVDVNTGITTAVYTPTNNQTINDVDAGFMGLYSIGNQVWHDIDNDGTFEAGEPIFGNVPVRLIAADGTTVLANTSTDANGRYVFKYLNAGTYYVEVGVPATYQSSADIATSGTPNATDNDDNGPGTPNTGYVRSNAVVLTANAGISTDANWNESDHGVAIMGMIDPTSNPKAYYTVDFGFRIDPNCPPPSTLCAGESYTLTADAGWTNYKWYFDADGDGPGAAIDVTANATGNIYPNANQIGTYTWTADDASGCPVNPCCPIVLELGPDCCELLSAGKTDESCNSGNLADPNDDYITFSLNPTGTGLGASYSVSTSLGMLTRIGGGSLSGIPYGSPVAFRLQNGSANGTLYTITVTDINGAPCTVVTTVQQEVCPVPILTHDKTGPVISTQMANGSYNVTYTILVNNSGIVPGVYTLYDTPTFDDDISINGTPTYTTNAPGNAANPGPLNLSGLNATSNTLASSQPISAGATHTYTLTYNVTLDLSANSGGNNTYSACGSILPGNPVAGQGLFNQSRLDSGSDGSIEETDEVCGDLPYITHDKTGPVVSTQQANGSYNVTYTVVVRNLGGASGDYDLTDTPTFDDDIAINSASYTRDIPALGSTALSTTNGATNTLASDVVIAPGAAHTYTLSYNVTLDLRSTSSGNNTYTECGDGTPGNPAPGEGLYNATALDTNDDGTPDETDEVCGDLPYITHRKDQVTVSNVPNPDGTYTVVYTVQVQNLGGASGSYDLIDTPSFDDDIVISAASYSTTNVVPAVAGGALSLINNSPNTLANDINIAAGATHTYTLTYRVKLDLAATSTDGGNNVYTACGATTNTAGPTLVDASVAGQGLYNATKLDTNNDGTPEEEDEICADLPYITHDKTGPVVSVQQANGSYNVTYTVTVRNLGGALGDYDLSDTPTFDDDITINSASYSSSTPPNLSGALSTTNAQANALGNDVVIAAGATHTYTLTYNVTLNLGAASGGDNVYTKCGHGTPGDPAPGEGLYNATTLDLNDDGIPEERDEVCGDLPVLQDFGDLPDTQAGVSTGDYQTLLAHNGPRHQLREVPQIYLGASVDSDTDGQPDLGAGEDGTNGDDNDGDGDDENGVVKPVMIFQGENAVFTVNVTTNTNVFVYGYIDWNNDGDFNDAGEVQSTATAATGPVTLTFAVPVNAVAGVNLGARFRVGTIQSEVNTPLGSAQDGEVEDYLVSVKALDYGDLPAPYLTTEVQDGPRHAVASTPELYLGSVVDIDPDGQPDADAGETDGGDDGDSTGGDDEDGVIEPAMIFRGETAAFQVAVVNKTASAAYVYGYLDWNDDGDFADADEVQFTTVAANTSATVTLSFNVPLNAVINNDLGARFRVGTIQDEVDQATGFAMNGEVEDYLVRVKGLDFGDLPTPPYATLDGVDGPRHGVSENPTVYLGTAPDVELDGQPDADAGETGNGDGADENGVVEPAMLFQGEEAKFTVNVVTNTTAYLYGYIDWNGDGDFSDAEEVQWATVAATGPVTLTFNVPLNAVINSDLGARFRIGTVQDQVDSPLGFAMDGEVEDYEVRVKGLDYGDLPPSYATLEANDGPRHGVAETPTTYLGGSVDTDPDGQPDADAGEVNGGDDGDGNDDETGVVEPPMIFQGEKATFTVNVTTNTTAYVYGYIDWNGDKDFNDANEVQWKSVASSGPVTLIFDVPLNAVINTDLGARFRVGTVQDQVDQATGFAMDGEVEDYLVQVKGLDYGDLPDFFASVSTGDYQTNYTNNGPRHGVPAVPQLFLGAVVDVDGDGQPDLGAGEDGTGGDDNDGDASDDEDGVVGPPMIFRGEEASFAVTLNLTNLTGTTAYVYGYIDWNGNGILGDTPAEVANGSSGVSGPITLLFNVPLGAVANSNLGARFRVGSVESQINVPNGFAMDGEVEDYLVRVKGLDFGDLPTPYATLDANDGPRHAVSETPQVYLGSAVDIDDDGQPDTDAGELDGGDDGDGADDEDGVIEPAMLFRGETAAFRVAVVNSSANTAYLYGYIDWNKDGDFADAEEVQFATVAANTSATVTLTFNVPLNAVINSDLGARFRIGTVQDEVDQATGFAMNGEVEDYLVRVKGLDFGDLPPSYATVDANDGPRHGQPENPQVYFGVTPPDVEVDGQPDPNAGETGNGDGVDENGVVEPTMLFRGEEARFKVNVTNTSGQTAFIYGYIDWNNDDLFSGAGEIASATLAGSGMVELVFQVPLNAVINTDLGVRFRIGTVQDQVDQATGFAMDGEVEDYLIQVKGLDFGDAGETFPTTDAQDGARHGVAATPTLYFGSTVDVELDGQPDDDAGETGGGDDGNADDEDGVSMLDAAGNPTMLITCLETTMRINTVIPAGQTAYLQGWIDFNDDGDWADAGEQVAKDIALTSANGTYYLKFTVPCDAKITARTFLRFRLSTVQGLSYTGFAMDGEVEDYVEVLKGLDFGDLPTKENTNQFPTTLSDNGPHHVLDPTAAALTLGASVDADQAGTPSTLADGDDKADGSDDEDGITFLTPLIPGQQACIEIDAVNNTTQTAYLYAYMDYDGDCNLSPLFNIPVPVGGLTDYKYCFTVPTDESSSMGMAFFRFRLGTNVNEVNVPTGLAMNGEVEDYKLQLAKVGNIVWFDRNADGIQNESEKDYGMNGVVVNLIWAGKDGIIQTTDPASPQGDDSVYETTTATLDINGDPLVGAPGPDDKRGEYYFCGLLPGSYRIVVMNPTDMYATTNNTGLEDDRDSDGTGTQIGGVEKSVVDFTLKDPLQNPVGEDGIEDQEIIDGFPTNIVKSYPDNQVDQSLDFGFTARDFGDLPEMAQGEMFPTTIANNGAAHTVPNPALTPEIPYLYLGAKIDTEPDGQPAAMADGDDGNNLFDEDGVRMLSPMVPGEETCVEVTSTIPSGVTGYLQGWIDWNGNGKLDDGEQVADDYALVSGTNVITKVCFDVPATAMFNEGMVFMRWRLSTERNLGFTGLALDGEVEDYKRQLGKVGNLVWEDENFNGLQDPGEEGIKDQEVRLVWAGPDGKVSTTADNKVYVTKTDSLGEYYFCGLIEGNYKLIVPTPEDMTPTRPNVQANSQDVIDSDGSVMLSPVMDLSMVMDSFGIADVTTLPEDENGLEDDPNVVGGFPDNQVDQTHDFGFAGLDYGDLPEEPQGEDFNTTMANNGPVHVLNDELRLGQCADAERDGKPDDDAGVFDGRDGDQGNGDDGMDTKFAKPEGYDCKDDEDGIRFITPLIPGVEACVEVTYTAVNGGVLQAWIDFNGNGSFNAGEELSFVGGGALAAGTNQTVQKCFTVPANAIYNDGVAFIRFRLSATGGLTPDGPDKYDETTVVPGGEVEDYMVKLAKVGNLVWEDRNYNGQQDDVEEDLGINGTVVALVYAGANGTVETSLSSASFPLTAVGDDRIYYDTTSTFSFKSGDTIRGLYYFCGLIEGTYDVVVLGPKDLTPTRPNLITTSQDEDKDSDGLETARNLTTQRALVHSGNFTIKDQKAICELAEGEEGIGDQDLSNLLDVNNVGTWPDNQVDQRFDFGFIGLDFGDLPQEDELTGAKYNTTIGENGPRHIIKPDFYLGAGVDAELDGQPDDQAGSGAYGVSEGDDAADNDPNSWKQGVGNDDEDGIKFLTPLVPGYEACIELKYALPDNFNGPDGYLNAWIDYNGNGVLDAGEKLAWSKLNGAAAPVEPNTGALELEKIYMTNGGGKVIVCFKVPADAAYFTGNVLSRFRLSENPRLSPDGILAAEPGYVNGRIPCGEVEDYFMKLSKVGNLVWEDRNYNGIQDAGEPPLKGVPIKLEYAGLDGVFGSANKAADLEYTYLDTTDASGRYYFCGLIGDNTYDPSGVDTVVYKLTAQDPAGMTPTVDTNSGVACNKVDANGDDTNIDDKLTSITFAITNPMGLCKDELHPIGINDQGTVGTFPDMQVDETLDFGYVGFDYGDLPVAGTNYLTPRDSLSAQFSGKFGPRHAIQPKLYLGEGVDGELNGQPDADAGSKNGGDDDGQGLFGKGSTADDETGVRLLSPMIPGELAYLKVTYTSQDTVLAGGYADKDAYLRSFIDFNGDGDLNDAEDVLTFTAMGTSMSTLTNIAATDNPILPGGVNQMRVLAFRVPLSASFRDGTAFIRHRLSWEANLGPDNNAFHQNTPPFVNTALAYPRGEVEDYAVPVAKVGNLSWFDHDVKGDQNEEDFVKDLQLVLIWGGVDETTGKFDTVGYQRTMGSAGSVTDVLYNLSIVPNGSATMPPASNDTPGQIVKTNAQGLYSFQGLIPGNYYLVPLKYLQPDSASFVNAYPKHRVLTLKDNLGSDDQNDSDGMPGALIRINDGNGREPEVCVSPQPVGERGKLDSLDAANMNAMSARPFPDSLYNQTIDFGWVDEPNIEANLDIVGVYFPTSQICGNFNVIAHLCVKNPQEVPLDSLQAFLNLRDAYGNALYTGTKPVVSIADSAYVKGPAYGKFRKSQLGAKAQLVPNPNYNGVTDTRLLIPTSEDPNFVLKGDSVVCIRIEFEIDPAKTDKYPWMLQGSVTARATGFTPAGTKRPLTDYFVKSPRFGKHIVVSDLSDEVNDPMVGSDMIAFEGMVADRDYSSDEVDKYLDENDKTVQNDECWLKTQWVSGQRDVKVALNSKCEAIINAEIFVPNFDPACGFDKYTEGSYYAVIIQDKWTNETIWTSDDPRPFDARNYWGRNLIYKVKSVANHCFSIWGEFILEDKIGPVVKCAPDTDRKVVNGNPSGTYTFVCTDIDSVLNVKKSWTNTNYAYYTGVALANDSCGNTWLDNVTDQLEVLADCGESANAGFVYARIKRTFFFTDEKGNQTTCTQIINFRRPRIVLPECKVEVPNNLANASADLLPADLVKAPFNLVESVPYFFNGAGKRIYLTGRDYCNLAVNYTDETVFTVGQCGRKIIRRWTLFDWCYGQKGNQTAYPVFHLVPGADANCYAGLAWNEGANMLSWEQVIIVGDNGDPIVKVPDFDRDGVQGSGYIGGERDNPAVDKLPVYDAGDVLEFSTSPMDCRGSYLFTRADLQVIEQSKWCFDLEVVERAPILDLFERPTGRYEWKKDAGVVVKGDCDKGYQITGVPMTGKWFLRLRVYDVCYGDTVIYYPIRAVDKIAPTMVCDDKLVLTLDNTGFGHVSAAQVDEGSNDNCGKVEWMRVRRPVSDDCNPNFVKVRGVVDANNNGKIDAYDPKSTAPQDYVDVNRNRKADPEEYFVIDSLTKQLMTPLMDSVPFFCCDQGSVMIQLWGADKAGNRNYCWKNITIEDKVAATCSAPWDITIHCDDKRLATIDDKLASAKAFGDLVINSGGNCAKLDTTYTVIKRLKCGAGTIERIWTLTKHTTKGDVVATCKQVIKVLPIREYNICFPKDANFDCKTPIVDTLIKDELGCDLLAVNVSDKRYDASTDECYKIFRTYTVINWCAYSDECGDPMEEGQVYVVNRATFENYGKAPIYVLVRDKDRNGDEEFYLSKDLTPNNTGDIQFTPPYCANAFSGNPYGLPEGEYYHSFMYTQIIKVYDSERPVVTGVRDTFCTSLSACTAGITKVVTIKDNCTDLVELERQQLMIAPLQTTDAGAMILYSTPRWSVKELGNGQFEIKVADVPQGTHDLIVVGRDECGNLSVATRIPFTVKDCKAPAPICINGLSTELMPDGNGSGMMAVWAKDFVASPIYDCNGQGPETKDGLKLITKYSINRVGQAVNANQTSLSLTCADAGKPILVELHAWDEAGNHDFCVTFVEVQDNRKVCAGSATLGEISGLITTDDLRPVLGVSVDLSGGAQMSQNTAANGAYQFSNLTKGNDYTVAAQLDKDHLNGVSTLDLVHIQKHILGVKALENPYRMIAADVNNSRTITTLDMIQIRKLILAVDTKFTSVPSWKFVDATYKFPDPANPWSAAFPEVVNVNDLEGKVKADFIAVKMGDVNGNASASGAMAAEVRGTKNLSISTAEQQLKQGQNYTIVFKAKDMEQIKGFQFTLNVDPSLATIEGLDYMGVMKAEHFGYFPKNGQITTSFNVNTFLGVPAKGALSGGETTLFALKLRAEATVALSSILELNSRLTNTEAYNQSEEVMGVQLSYNSDSVDDRAVLRQNTPNPFSDETAISFYLPKASKAKLTIRDVKGALIYRVEGSYANGNSQVILKQEHLGASGVLYYTLETSDFVDTKKMVLLKQ